MRLHNVMEKIWVMEARTPQFEFWLCHQLKYLRKDNVLSWVLISPSVLLAVRAAIFKRQEGLKYDDMGKVLVYFTKKC